MGYLLKGDFSEEEVLKKNESIRKIIEEEKGLIIQEKNPQKQNLAYSIKGQNTAYSGSIKFIFLTEKISSLKKNLEKLDLLRLFLNKKKKEKETMKRPFKRRPGRQIGQKESFVSSPVSVPARDEHQGEAIQVEEIDKKLEEILGQ